MTSAPIPIEKMVEPVEESVSADMTRPDSAVLVVDDGGRVTGYAVVTVGPGLPQHTDLHARISDFHVDDGFRDAGLEDELFSAARFASASSALTGSANAGVSGPLPLGLRLAYDVTHTPGDTPADFANWTHAVSVTLETPCRCAGLQLSASVPFHDLRLLRAPGFAFRIDLKSLGSFATF